MFIFICDYNFECRKSICCDTVYFVFFELKSPLSQRWYVSGKKDLRPGSHLLDATQGLPACFQCIC